MLTAASICACVGELASSGWELTVGCAPVLFFSESLSEVVISLLSRQISPRRASTISQFHPLGYFIFWNSGASHSLRERTTGSITDRDWRMSTSLWMTDASGAGSGSS